MFDRKAFYDHIRKPLGSLTQANVHGFELVLNEAERRKMPVDQTAYTLATMWWETGKTMQPVREAFWVSHTFEGAEEWRRKHLRYYPYYGRGYVQTTHKENYDKASKRWNIDYRKEGEPKVDFVADPDLIMDPKYGVPLAFDGLVLGWYSGKKLSDYIDGVDESSAEDLREFKLARRVVNGNDRAIEIGKLGMMFEDALRAGRYGSE